MATKQRGAPAKESKLPSNDVHQRGHRRRRGYTMQGLDRLLSEEYGPVSWLPRLGPLEELISTILSQHTSDLNSERAFRELVRRFPTWEAVMAATPEELAEAIRAGGLAQQKAPRIQAVLREIVERCGQLDISFLAEMTLEEARAWLQSLPGVGPKTAAMVLCFALGMPAFPVDTHIHRVTRRLGLIGPRVSADQAHDLLGPAILPERVFPLHVYLITHGRQVCKAQRPRCDRCVLAERCPSWGQFL